LLRVAWELKTYNSKIKTEKVASGIVTGSLGVQALKIVQNRSVVVVFSQICHVGLKKLVAISSEPCALSFELVDSLGF
jgi:hypothetical protein